MPADRQAGLTQAMCILERIRRALEAERASIKAELAAYPAPIPACDAQYNHLAEERGRIAAELARLTSVRLQLQAAPDALAMLDELLSQSAHLAQLARRAVDAAAPAP